MIFEQVKASIKPGLQLPGTRYTVKGLGERYGEPALIYKIPNNREPGQHYEKGIAKSEWELAYRQLLTAGELSRRWFDSNMKDCAKRAVSVPRNWRDICLTRRCT